MPTFAEGELHLPIYRIIWAPDNAAHGDHLHVEGFPHVRGTLNNCTSKWTEAITEIRGALDGHFGEGDHWMVDDDSLAWTHMGVFNCRNIAGTSTPSQHAFSNAIDIGPYYGTNGQQKFYDFLTRKKEDTNMALSNHEERVLKQAVASLDEVGSNGTALKYMVLHLRNHPTTSGTVDSHARSLAKKALDKLAAIKNVL